MNTSIALASTGLAKPGLRLTNPRRSFGLAALLKLLATWEDRKRFRLQLQAMVIANPHLIDDIGMTARQVEAEIAKRFWQG